MDSSSYCKKSFGEIILKGLRVFPSSVDFQINGETGETLTARDVLVRSVQVASGLRKLGVQVEDVVAILSHYSENSIAAIFGALMQGAAPFPLEQNLQQREMEHMFNLCRPKIIFLNSDRVIDARKALAAIGHQAPIFVLDGEGEGGQGFDQVLDVDVDVDKFESSKIDRPDQRIAAVMPSSGTTGLPKGVAATHAAYLCQFDLWSKHSPRTPFLSLTPPYWITGFCFLIQSAVFGLTRVYLTTTSAENIVRAIDKYKPTWTLMAPITLARILNYPDLDKYKMESLTAALVGGSSVPHSTIQLSKEKLPQMCIFQCYGATEISGAVTEPFDSKYVHSAGKIMTLHEVKIVDLETEKCVGANVDGEIRLRTPGLFKCYMGDEQATRDAFDKDGFYRTGDIGRVVEEQYLYITGRSKELFKVKNHQVSPAELEDVIRGLAGVADVAVVGIPHEIEQNHPRALVVKQPGSSITLQQIVDEVADKLSETKHLLAGAQFVDAIPRNTTGKLIRRDLPKLVVLP